MSDAALKHVYTGKVRELYEVAIDRLLMVASDRISVFDVVLPDEIPDKGRVLTGLSNWWFEQTASIAANHVISADPTDFPEIARDMEGRAMLVRATRPVRLECVVRGYVFGHGWSEYRDAGTVGGYPAPAGLREAERLPEPLFTPTTKAEQGHDVPLRPDEAIALVGRERYERLRDLSLQLYEFGAARAGRVRVDPRRHQIRVRGARRRDLADRRGDDTRLVALLACRRVPARRLTTLVRQAVRT